MSRTLSGLFLIGALTRPRKRKGTNRENPQTVPEQIGKIPEQIRKVPERTKKDIKGRTSPDRETPPFETPPVWRPLIWGGGGAPILFFWRGLRCPNRKIVIAEIAVELQRFAVAERSAKLQLNRVSKSVENERRNRNRHCNDFKSLAGWI